MASQAQLGFSAVLSRGDGGSPQSFTDIAEIYELGPLGETRSEVEVTHHKSPDRTRERIAGLIDGDTLDFRCNLVAADPTHGHTGGGMVAVFKSGARDTYRLRWPADEATPDIHVEFDLVILHWEYLFPLDDRAQLGVSARISGPVTSLLSP